MSAGSVLDQRVSLNLSPNEREGYDHRQTMYCLIRQLEFLEKANSQGVFQTAEDESKYAEECDKLLRQYKQNLQWLNGGKPFDLEGFMKEYEISPSTIPVVMHRITVGVNGLVEHGGNNTSSSTGQDAQFVVDAVTAFITVSDMIAMDCSSVDQLHPQMTKILDALNKLPKLPADYPAKIKMRDWLTKLSNMKADESLDESDGRQLTFDTQTELTNLRQAAANF